MLARLRRRATFANVTSALALFVALGGTSYAAITLPADSVGSDQIRTGAVGTPEIRKNGVGASEINVGAVRSSEITTNAVHGTEIASNSVGNVDMKKDAVTSANVKDGTLEAADLSDAARSSLAGNAPFRAAVNKAGTVAAGNGTVVHNGPGVYTVDFAKDVSACFYSATLAAVKNGPATDTPDPGSVNITPGAAATSIVVNTFTGGAPTDEPFHLGVSC